MRMRKVVARGVIAVCALGLGASRASSATLGFACVTNSIAGDCAIGASQLSVEVTDVGGGQVLFTFNNAGPAASSIADVYFDDGALLAISFILNSPGVSFSQGASPPDLPGGSNASPPFTVTAGFSADSDPPTQPNGVNPGEALGIRFTLQPGMSFLDVLDDLGDGTLRAGIHLQGLATGGSEGFVSTPLPESGTLTLIGMAAAGLTALGSWRRRGLRRST
jgi:hypothetical protein